MQFLPRKRQKPTIDLSPLVDVVFLLIIFFTVSTTFRVGTGLPINLPSAGTSASQNRGPVEVTISENGRIELAGSVYTSVDALREPLSTALEDADPRSVIIRGDRKTAYETVVGVLDLARDLEAQGVTLATERPVSKDPS